MKRRPELLKEQIDKIHMYKVGGNSIYRTAKDLRLTVSEVIKHYSVIIDGSAISDSEFYNFKKFVESMPSKIDKENLQLDQSIVEGIDCENYCISILTQLRNMEFGAKVDTIKADLGIKRDHRHFMGQAKKMGIIRSDGNTRIKRPTLTERGKAIVDLIDKLYFDQVEIEWAGFTPVPVDSAMPYPACLSLIVPAQLIKYYMRVTKQANVRRLKDGKGFLKDTGLVERLRNSGKYHGQGDAMGLDDVLDYFNGDVEVEVQPLTPSRTRITITDVPEKYG
jgi:hypothetical protein